MRDALDLLLPLPSLSQILTFTLAVLFLVVNVPLCLFLACYTSFPSLIYLFAIPLRYATRVRTQTTLMLTLSSASSTSLLPTSSS